MGLYKEKQKQNSCSMKYFRSTEGKTRMNRGNCCEDEKRKDYGQKEETGDLCPMTHIKMKQCQKKKKLIITGLHDGSFLCSLNSTIFYSLPNVHIISIVSNIRPNYVNYLLGYRHHDVHPTLRQAL